MSKADVATMADSLALKGFVAVAFGAAVVFWPHLTWSTSVYLFSGYILAMGVLSLIASFTGAKKESMSGWLMVLVALLEVIFGVYLFRHPDVTFSTFILLAGIVLIVRGLFVLAGPFVDGDSGMSMNYSGLVGLVSVVTGVVLFFQSSNQGVAYVWILGLYALITGPLLLALSRDVRESAK